MKMTVINGSMRHGSTWNCIDSIRTELRKHVDLEVNEFFLPKDMPHFCQGCYSCFYNGEDTCPDAIAMKPILKATLEADIIVLTSPVYGMDVTGQMKSLLDHMCFLWMSHRPDPRMFNKIGLTVSTTAGAGLGHTTKTLRNSLNFFGVKKIYSFKMPVSAMKWKDVSKKKQEKIQKETKKISKKLIKATSNINKLHNPIFRSIFFKMMIGLQKKNDWNLTDRKHWEENGWLSGINPFNNDKI